MTIRTSNREEMRANAITVPVSAEFRKKIKEAAANKGLTMSAYIRIVVADAIEKG